jgi:hypothetical protein
MCLAYSRITGLARWNWDGDEIIHESVVPSSRPIVGQGDETSYDIDVREFLVSEDNQVIKKTIRENLRRYAGSLAWGNWDLFSSKRPGSFDHRADVVTAFVGDTIKYKRSGKGDAWMFPDETLSIRSGDCEDRAFLLASLLIGAGISDYNIRVAIGKIIVEKPADHSGGSAPRKRKSASRSHDHVWVMYKNEAGEWMLLEPLLGSAAAKRKTAGLALPTRRDRVEYRPQFVFNNRHLWAIHGSGIHLSFSDSVVLSQEWKKIDPAFAGEVHKTLLQDALTRDPEGNPASADVMAFTDRMNSYFHTKFGYILDDVDARRRYDPLEHFDNGLLQEAWNLLDYRTQEFARTKSPDVFSLVAHGLADFYAHSSYGHFADLDPDAKAPGNTFKIYSDAALGAIQSRIQYDSGSGYDLATWNFSANRRQWNGTPAQRSALWAGKILSGRFAQQGDQNIPFPKNFSVPEYLSYIMEPRSVEEWPSGHYLNVHPEIASLPHHYEVAVDEEDKDSRHILYSGAVFKTQFERRKNTAIHHIRKVFYENWKA